ncbi:HNH endonuclease [Actinomadura adrarensis]|uniref:HNH endonuclease n=1 Tax=Actinomadura adrarensis TaxID=1819600 RepID=A0ABW3CTX1_9ACTN
MWFWDLDLLNHMHHPADVRAYVGVTDGSWAAFLAARPQLDEVNFWRPSGGRAFRVLEVGEPFFFKSHAPENRIVGGGFYSGFVALPASEVWDLYGEGNGAASLTEMRERIAYYRRSAIGQEEDPIVGCVLLRDVRFFAAERWADPPLDFAPNIVQGKSFDLAAHAEAEYFRDLIGRLLGHDAEIDLSRPWHRPGPVYGDPRLAPQRLGQQAFKAVVLAAYEGCCAVTGSNVRPILQAAHVRPLHRGGEHRLDNGILLRSDVHTLFDQGYLGLDAEHRLTVSPHLDAEFGSGAQYYRSMAGQPVALPNRSADRPGKEFIEWHTNNVFKA